MDRGLEAVVLWSLGIALAHQPHDPAWASGLAQDGVALVTRSPAQNWRPTEIARSADGGFTWVPAMTGVDNVGEIVDLSLSPNFSADGVGLVTTILDGAFVTIDGGASWERSSSPRALDLGAIAHDGLQPVLLVHQIAGPVWRSVDEGDTWTAVTAALPAAHLEALFGEVVVATASQVLRSVDAGLSWTPIAVADRVLDVSVGPGVTFVGGTTGLWRSDDGLPFDWLDAFDEPVLTVGVSPTWATDRTVIASTLLVGAYVSTDGGGTFALFDTGLDPSDQTDRHYYAFRYSPAFEADGRVFANAFEGLFTSADHGRNWVESDLRTPGMITAIAVSPRFADDRMLLVSALDSGVRRSTDGGDHFAAMNSGLNNAGVYDVALVEGPEGLEALAGLRSAVLHAAAPWTAWTQGPFVPDYPTRIAPSPTVASDGIVLAGHRTAGLFRTTDFGASWQSVSAPMSAISGIAWGPDGTTVLAGTIDGLLLRSVDAGNSFAAVAPFDLAAAPVFVAAGPAGFVVGSGTGLLRSDNGVDFSAPAEFVPCVVHQVAMAPDGTAFVACRGGQLFRSAAEAYEAVGSELTAFGAPHEIAFSPAFVEDGIVFAAVDEVLFRSDDRGNTFAAIGPSVLRIEEYAQRVRVPEAFVDSRTDAAASATAKAIVAAGSWLEVPFTGVAVSWVGERGPEYGVADVLLDGTLVATVDTAGSRGKQVVLTSVEGLSPGRHVIRLVASGSAPVVVDAIDVFQHLPPVTTEPPDLPPLPPVEAGCGCDSPGRAPPGAVLLLVAFAVGRRRLG